MRKASSSMKMTCNANLTAYSSSCATWTLNHLIEIQATLCKSYQSISVPKNGLLQLLAQTTLRNLGFQEFSKGAERPCMFTKRIGAGVRAWGCIAVQRIVEHDRRFCQGEKILAIAFDGAKKLIVVHARLVSQPCCESRPERDGQGVTRRSIAVRRGRTDCRSWCEGSPIGR